MPYTITNTLGTLPGLINFLTDEINDQDDGVTRISTGHARI